MLILFYIIQKEFIQIFRNKAILPMMTVLPIIQLILLSSVATNEVKRVNIAIVDKDNSTASRLLTGKIASTTRFHLLPTERLDTAALELMQRNDADIILGIPANFERNFTRGEQPALQLLVNAVNGQQATVGAGYLTSTIASFNLELLNTLPASVKQRMSRTPMIAVSSQSWYNPELKYTHFMVPGILAELACLLTIVLSAMNVVREREIGTIEQINVTPIKKWQFIIGKMVPFLFVGMVLVFVGLVAGKLIFNIPMVGSVPLMLGYAVVALISVLGLGLLISNFADTQQQAMFIAFFFIMIFILMCGLFTPIESMPKWAQLATIPNPLAHFISVSRKVLMKGSGLADIKMEFLYSAGLAVVFNGLAIWTYKRRD